MQAPAFLQQLQADVRRLHTLVATELAPLPEAVLNAQPGPGRWSALECLEHLNRYCRYYHPAFERALQRPGTTAGEVRYSWLGRKSLALVEPTNGQRHKTVKHMNPAGSTLRRAGLDEFLGHQTQLLALLSAAASADLNRRAVPVEFFRLLKLRTGEALEFVVRHAERHVQQAQRAAAPAQMAAPALVV